MAWNENSSSPTLKAANSRPRADAGTGPPAPTATEVLTLHIRPDHPSGFQARVFSGTAQVGAASHHDGVASAIAFFGHPGAFPGVVAFHIWYEGACLRAIDLAQMREDAHGLAQRLAVLSALWR